MIRNREITQPEQISQRFKQPFRLSKRLLEHQADGQRGFNRHLGIHGLRSPFAGRACYPGRQRLFSKPHRQVAPPLKSRLVAMPVGDAILGPEILCRQASLCLYGMVQPRQKNYQNTTATQPSDSSLDDSCTNAGTRGKSVPNGNTFSQLAF